jgi:hypothetical protein
MGTLGLQFGRPSAFATPPMTFLPQNWESAFRAILIHPHVVTIMLSQTLIAQGSFECFCATIPTPRFHFSPFRSLRPFRPSSVYKAQGGSPRRTNSFLSNVSCRAPHSSSPKNIFRVSPFHQASRDACLRFCRDKDTSCECGYSTSLQYCSGAK